MSVLVFTFGAIFGAVILLPLVLLVMTMKVQCTSRGPKEPPIRVPSSHTSPYLYKQFQKDTTSTEPVQEVDTTFLDKSRDALLAKLEPRGTADVPGETMDWLNLVVVTALTTVKQVLVEADRHLDEAGICIKDEREEMETQTQEEGKEQGVDASIAPPKLLSAVDGCKKGSGGTSTMMTILNKMLTEKLKNIPFLGPARVTYLDIRSLVPAIRHVKVITMDLPTNTIVFDLGIDLTTDCTVELDLTGEVGYAGWSIASFPAQAALANLEVKADIRISIDPGEVVVLDLKSEAPATEESSMVGSLWGAAGSVYNTAGTVAGTAGSVASSAANVTTNMAGMGSGAPAKWNHAAIPTISISLTEAPHVKYDLATSFGHNEWLTNMSVLHGLVHQAIMLGASVLIAPNRKMIELDKDMYKNIVSSLFDLATKCQEEEGGESAEQVQPIAQKKKEIKVD